MDEIRSEIRDMIDADLRREGIRVLALPKDLRRVFRDFPRRIDKALYRLTEFLFEDRLRVAYFTSFRFHIELVLVEMIDAVRVYLYRAACDHFLHLRVRHKSGSVKFARDEAYAKRQTVLASEPKNAGIRVVPSIVRREYEYMLIRKAFAFTKSIKLRELRDIDETMILKLAYILHMRLEKIGIERKILYEGRIMRIVFAYVVVHKDRDFRIGDTDRRGTTHRKITGRIVVPLREIGIRIGAARAIAVHLGVARIIMEMRIAIPYDESEPPYESTSQKYKNHSKYRDEDTTDDMHGRENKNSLAPLYRFLFFYKKILALKFHFPEISLLDFDFKSKYI